MKGKLVGLLELAVVFVLLLDSVVCEVSEDVVSIVGELLDACAEIAFFVPVGV